MNIEHTSIDISDAFGIYELSASRIFRTIFNHRHQLFLNIKKYRRRREMIYFMMNKRVLSISRSFSVSCAGTHCYNILHIFSWNRAKCLYCKWINYKTTAKTNDDEEEKTMKNAIQAIRKIQCRYEYSMKRIFMIKCNFTEMLGSSGAKSLLFISNSPMNNIFFTKVLHKMLMNICEFSSVCFVHFYRVHRSMIVIIIVIMFRVQVMPSDKWLTEEKKKISSLNIERWAFVVHGNNHFNY